MLNDNTYLRERDELLAHLVDAGTISAAAARRERWRERGICSDPDCEQAIDGWCAGCGAKLCLDCLMRHDLRHAHAEESDDDA
jgi:hypothetical protein